MTVELVLAVDCSTTACKAIAFDAQGQAVAEGRAPIELSHPAPDGWEQDAERWWSAWLQAVSEVTRSLGERAARVVALCNTHQRETFVLTDEQSRPLHPALVWMDARCTEQVRAAKERVGPRRLHELSGKPACTTPSMYKLMYLLDARKDLAGKHPRVLDVHGFVTWRATGRCATSLASADPLGLVDMAAKTWSAELLEAAGVTVGQLPELVAPGAELGQLSGSVAAACGLPAGLPVVAGAGDGQAAGLGAGITTAGRAYLNLGTAVVAGVLSERYLCEPSFRTLYGAAPDTFFLESDLKGGTFTISWLLDRLLGPGETERHGFEELLAGLEREALALPAGADGLILVPYWNGVMNPYWDDDATGIVIGWSGHHGRAHLYRAILEGIAFEQRKSLDGIAKAAGSIVELVVMGGGSKSDLWCQILADVTGREVVRAGTPEATALGAGLLAAVAAGWHADLDAAARAMTSTGDRFAPGQARATYERLYAEVYDGLYADVSDRLQRLASLRREPN